MNGEQNNTLAAIWEAHTIMRDVEDHLDNLRVFVKVREKAIASSQPEVEEIKQEEHERDAPPAMPSLGGMGGFIRLQ